MFAGTDKTSTMYSVREFGDMCLLLALDKVIDYGDTLNIPQADERNRKVERKEVMLFNVQAFKEAVINAFQHNLWISGTSPMFTAFKDRIEITSIGTLPPHQTKEGFYAGVSIPVNDKLTEIFVQLHISEKSGRGVPRIVGEYGEKAFDFANNAITVTIPYNRLNLGGTPQVTPQVENALHVDANENRIIEYCKQPKSLNEILAYLGLKDRKNLRTCIVRLLEQGRISMTIPDKPRSSKQKYITVKQESVSNSYSDNNE